MEINDWPKVRCYFQILQTPKIPQKGSTAQNGPLDITSQMRQTPTMEDSEIWRNQEKTMMQSFSNTLKHCTMVSVCFSKMKSSHDWGQSYLKPNIQRDIWRLRCLKKNFRSIIDFQCQPFQPWRLRQLRNPGGALSARAWKSTKKSCETLCC